MNEQPERESSREVPGTSYEHVLISVSNPETADQLIRLSCRLTDASSVLHIMNVTTEAPFPERAASWRRSSQLVMDMTHLATRLGRVAKPLAATAKSIPGAIVNAVGDVEADLVIMGWFGRVTPMAVKKSRVVNKVLNKADAATAVLKSRGELEEVKRLVVPVGLPGINEERLSVVQALRREQLTPTVLVHVLGEGSGLDEAEARDMLGEATQGLGQAVETRVVAGGDVVEGLLSVAEKDDLIVVGPGREWVFGSFLFGRHADQITNRAPCSVLMYKSREQKLFAWSRGLLKAIGQRLTGRSE
ncbi:MAG: universal stress protein [Candidatus Brocadiia bacterium]